MDPTIIASGIAFITAVVTAVISSKLSHRKLRLEMLSSFRTEIARNQIKACEAVWSVLGPTTFAEGDNRVIVGAREAPVVYIDAARKLSTCITDVFYSSSGLYLSRSVRDALFDLRHFIRDEFLSNGADPAELYLEISKNKAKQFRNKATKLRIALRAEIGVEDLKAAKELSSVE